MRLCFLDESTSSCGRHMRKGMNEVCNWRRNFFVLRRQVEQRLCESEKHDVSFNRTDDDGVNEQEDLPSLPLTFLERTFFSWEKTFSLLWEKKLQHTSFLDWSHLKSTDWRRPSRLASQLKLRSRQASSVRINLKWLVVVLLQATPVSRVVNEQDEGEVRLGK